MDEREEMNEDKKRKKKRELANNSLDSEPVEAIRVIKVQPKIPFSVWFNRMELKGKVRFWQEDALAVFMTKQGLSTAETEDLYSEAFKRF